MRLTKERDGGGDGGGSAAGGVGADPQHTVDIILRRGSLYLLHGDSRYKYAHSILSRSATGSAMVFRQRRISIMLRDVKE